MERENQGRYEYEEMLAACDRTLKLQPNNPEAWYSRGYVLEAGRDRFEGRGPDLLNDPKVGELYLGAGRSH